MRKNTHSSRGWSGSATLLACLAVAGLLVMGGPADGADWQTGLACRQISQWQHWPSGLERFGLAPTGTTQTFQELVRVWARGNLGNVRCRFEVENRWTWRSAAGFGGWGEEPSRTRLHWWNWEHSFTTESRREILSTIERFDLAWPSGPWQFDLGRQPISLGTSHYIGILDVLAPFHPGYLDSSYKPGIDALRIRRGFGTAGEMELIAVPTYPRRDRALLGRWRENWHGFDVELVGGRFRDRDFAGLGYDGEIRKITCWGEIASFERKPSRESWRHGGRSHALSWIAGLEREVAPQLRLGAAYMHQDFGTPEARLLPALAGDAPFEEGWTFLGGTRYAVLTAKKEFTPLIKGDLNGLVNLNDGSKLWQPVVTVSLGDNSDVAFFAWIGQGTSLTPRGESSSEFGPFPSGGGFLLRWFR